MNTTEYVQHIIDEKQYNQIPMNICNASTYETAQLLSGSFTYMLYNVLWTEFYNMDSITEHLEVLYSNEQHYGILYFVALLANAVEFGIPIIYSQMSATDELVPFLSVAIIEDWLEHHETSLITETS
ncbi:MAG: hypothetical protein FWD05_14800 [Oscillospiraceae bacterium]|nr:hypothetical protein [Oscillospiraceae bacterium]